MVGERSHSLLVEVFARFMMQFHFVSLVQYIGWCFKEKMTDWHDIIRALAENQARTLRLISLVT
jgi:hypothetical protein